MAGVSLADIRSALSIPDSTEGAGPSQPKKQAQTTRKPEGISRELYSLIGPSQPFLAAQLAKPRLKQKPKFATGGTAATKWCVTLKGFIVGSWCNQAFRELRTASEDPETESPFAKYNIQNPVYTYSQDEYSRFLDTSNRAATPKDANPDFEKQWTKDWTDYLFRLPTFDLEDLKHRYYSVCRKLIRNRPWPGDEASKTALINSLQFDIEREKMRKRYVEEDALYLEVRRLEQTERRFKRDREDLMRTLAGMDSGLPYIVEDNGGPLGILAESSSRGPTKKGRKNPALDGTDSPSTPSGPVSSTPTYKRPQNTKSAAYDAQHCIIRTELSSNTPATKAAHQPAYARSSKIPYLKNNSMQTKILQSFAEMGLSPSRLVMPTKENCAQLEGLLEAVTAMLETKKHLDKVDYDIQVLKKQLGMKTGEGDGDGEGSVKREETMDVDNPQDTETDGNEGRGQSVMSVRSVRSRKKSRAMSTSSVETAATSVSTRKRQKRG
ncbi:SWR1-complex protein 4 [Ephemerocybe angulata]|uniref:SWR1-complex protein 4 n=1 Tax=Ephemerocybe angulata TaxID=980116 RepID=A0A8H6IAS7_9AGAR|nr:SWR1-complex protein 4 [Tulosesus angulatus]